MRLEHLLYREMRPLVARTYPISRIWSDFPFLFFVIVIVLFCTARKSLFVQSHTVVSARGAGLLQSYSSVGLEHLPCTQGVKGSSPLFSTVFFFERDSLFYPRPPLPLFRGRMIFDMLLRKRRERERALSCVSAAVRRRAVL